MKRLSGLQLLEEREGEGRAAQRGDHVIYNFRTFLNKGDEVRIQEEQIRSLPKEVLRVVGNVTLIDHRTRLGRRQTVAGVEHTLIGMKVGGLSEGSHQPTSSLSGQRRPGVYSG